MEPSPEKLVFAHLRKYPVKERCHGFIWVKLDAAGAHELPDVPEFEDERWTYIHGPPADFAAGWRREVENYLDMTHFAFTHATTLGKAADMRVPAMEITEHPDGGFQMDAHFPALATPHEQPGKLQAARTAAGSAAGSPTSRPSGRVSPMATSACWFTFRRPATGKAAPSIGRWRFHRVFAALRRVRKSSSR